EIDELARLKLDVAPDRDVLGDEQQKRRELRELDTRQRKLEASKHLPSQDELRQQIAAEQRKLKAAQEACERECDRLQAMLDQCIDAEGARSKLTHKQIRELDGIIDP